MRTNKIENRDIEVVDKIKCDCCGAEFDWQKDEMETQEMLIIDTMGGYYSIFGDGAKITCDLCQHCVKKLLGEYLKIV